MRPRLGSLALLLALLFSIVAAPTAAADSLVTVDNSAGNSIATGTVVRSDPSQALLEVRNNYHFWVAVDVVSAHGAVLRPAALSEDLGGLFAGGALINPSGTAAWDGVFDSSTGGLATIRVHYDVTSAGGAVALAGNVLTIIADSLGASLAASSASGLVKSFTLIMDLPSFADFGRQIQQQDVWGLVTSIELLLGSPTGRATIKEALSELGVLASDSQLLGVASVVGIIDWAQTLVDLMRASISGTTDGSVTFSVAGPTPTPTLASRKSIVSAPHPDVSLKSAVAALDAEGTSVSQPPGEQYPQLDWCRNPTLANAMPRDGLDYCEVVVQRLYVAYVNTGNDKYFNQALGFFNYVWNWTDRPGWAYDQQATRNNMVLLLTQACRQDFPDYGNAIP